MKIKLFVVSMFILSTCLTVASAQATKPAKGIRSVDFRNFDHYFGMENEGGETLKIRNGIAKLNNGGDIYHVRKNDVAYGDVNGDGEEDAVVRIRLWTGASLRDFEILVYLYDSDMHKAEVTARLDMSLVQEDYKHPVCCTGEGLKVKNRHVIFEALTDGKILLDYRKITTFDYNLSGHELVMNVKPVSRKKPQYVFSQKNEGK